MILNIFNHIYWSLLLPPFIVNKRTTLIEMSNCLYFEGDEALSNTWTGCGSRSCCLATGRRSLGIVNESNFMERGDSDFSEGIIVVSCHGIQFGILFSRPFDDNDQHLCIMGCFRLLQGISDEEDVIRSISNEGSNELIGLGISCCLFLIHVDVVVETGS